MTEGPVVLTVSPGGFPGLAERLRRLPVVVEEHPLLTFAPPHDWAPVDRALHELQRFEALAFTSPRAAAAFVLRHAEVGGRSHRRHSDLPSLWSGGPGTEAALGALGRPVHRASDEAIGRLGAGAALAAAMIEGRIVGPVLFPCGEIRRDALPTRLRREGIDVTEVVCYRSVLADEAAARAAVERAGIMVVASPSVADLVTRAAKGAWPRLLAVGPTTAAAARAAGWTPAAVASAPDVDALVAGVRSLLSPGGANR